MSRILILSDEYPYDQTSGLHLRVSALCHELARYHECFFIAMSSDPGGNEALQNIPFAKVIRLPVRKKESRSWKRHIRLSNANYFEKNWTRYYQSTVAAVGEYARKWKTNALVSFAPAYAEIGAAIELPKMLDNPDCASLTLQRALDRRSGDMTLRERVMMRLQIMRQTARERHSLQTYDLTMTIAEPDRERFLEVSGVESERVIVVPNGVSPKFIQQTTGFRSRTRTVVFWGNLDFPPNWTAIVYFYKNVYLPYLAENGVEWHIIGKGSSDQLKQISEHPLIHMHGFQEDLTKFIEDKGVMINSMTEGSGLKNKVLEAFAMRIPVVSTSLGVEAINGVAGEHFLVGDTPEALAKLVLQVLDDDVLSSSLAHAASQLVLECYTWQVTGRKFADAVQQLL